MTGLFNKIPVPIAGLMLALAATGNLVAPYGHGYRNILGATATLILVLLVTKIILIPNTVAESLQNPAIASVVPTFSMGLMILSTHLIPYQPGAAYAVWVSALVMHIFLIACFTKKHILKFDIKKVLPSYFIVYVGIVAGSVTAPAYGMEKLGQPIFWFGLICYLILLPLVSYRVFRIRDIPKPTLPTIIIFAAPASLCLAGYINSFPEKNMGMLVFLTIISLAMAVFALLYMPGMLKLNFYPSYSAFTFPFVISAIAIKTTNGLLLSLDTEVTVLAYASIFLEAWAILIVTYVLVRYAVFVSQFKAEPFTATGVFT